MLEHIGRPVCLKNENGSLGVMVLNDGHDRKLHMEHHVQHHDIDSCMSLAYDVAAHVMVAVDAVVVVGQDDRERRFATGDRSKTNRGLADCVSMQPDDDESDGDRNDCVGRDCINTNEAHNHGDDVDRNDDTVDDDDDYELDVDAELVEFEHNLLARLQHLEAEEARRVRLKEIEHRFNRPRPKSLSCTYQLRLDRRLLRRQRIQGRANQFEFQPDSYVYSGNYDDCLYDGLDDDDEDASDDGYYDPIVADETTDIGDGRRSHAARPLVYGRSASCDCVFQRQSVNGQTGIDGSENSDSEDSGWCQPKTGNDSFAQCSSGGNGCRVLDWSDWSDQCNSSQPVGGFVYNVDLSTALDELKLNDDRAASESKFFFKNKPSPPFPRWNNWDSDNGCSKIKQEEVDEHRSVKKEYGVLTATDNIDVVVSTSDDGLVLVDDDDCVPLVLDETEARIHHLCRSNEKYDAGSSSKRSELSAVVESGSIITSSNIEVGVTPASGPLTAVHNGSIENTSDAADQKPTSMGYLPANTWNESLKVVDGSVDAVWDESLSSRHSCRHGNDGSEKLPQCEQLPTTANVSTARETKAEVAGDDDDGDSGTAPPPPPPPPAAYLSQAHYPVAAELRFSVSCGVQCSETGLPSNNTGDNIDTADAIRPPPPPPPPPPLVDTASAGRNDSIQLTDNSSQTMPAVTSPASTPTSRNNNIINSGSKSTSDPWSVRSVEHTDDSMPLMTINDWSNCRNNNNNHEPHDNTASSSLATVATVMPSRPVTSPPQPLPPPIITTIANHHPHETTMNINRNNDDIYDGTNNVNKVDTLRVPHWSTNNSSGSLQWRHVLRPPSDLYKTSNLSSQYQQAATSKRSLMDVMINSSSSSASNIIAATNPSTRPYQRTAPASHQWAPSSSSPLLVTQGSQQQQSCGGLATTMFIPAKLQRSAANDRMMTRLRRMQAGDHSDNRNSWPDRHATTTNAVSGIARDSSGSASALMAPYERTNSFSSCIEDVSIVAQILELDNQRSMKLTRMECLNDRLQHLVRHEKMYKKKLEDAYVNHMTNIHVGRLHWQKVLEQIEITRMITHRLEVELRRLSGQKANNIARRKYGVLYSFKLKLIGEARRKFDDLEFSLMELQTKYDYDDQYIRLADTNGNRAQPEALTITAHHRHRQHNDKNRLLIPNGIGSIHGTVNNLAARPSTDDVGDLTSMINSDSLISDLTDQHQPLRSSPSSALSAPAFARLIALTNQPQPPPPKSAAVYPPLNSTSLYCSQHVMLASPHQGDNNTSQYNGAVGDGGRPSYTAAVDVDGGRVVDDGGGVGGGYYGVCEHRISNGANGIDMSKCRQLKSEKEKLLHHMKQERDCINQIEKKLELMKSRFGDTSSQTQYGRPLYVDPTIKRATALCSVRYHEPATSALHGGSPTTYPNDQACPLNHYYNDGGTLGMYTAHNRNSLSRCTNSLDSSKLLLSAYPGENLVTLDNGDHYASTSRSSNGLLNGSCRSSTLKQTAKYVTFRNAPPTMSHEVTSHKSSHEDMSSSHSHSDMCRQRNNYPQSTGYDQLDSDVVKAQDEHRRFDYHEDDNPRALSCDFGLSCIRDMCEMNGCHYLSNNSRHLRSDSVRLRSLRNTCKQDRPLTRYLPLPGLNLDLRQHVENAGHMVEPYTNVITLTKSCCKGYLVKMGQKFRTWNKRWFVFDRVKRSFDYFVSQSHERKSQPRGQVSFESICEVYVDHLNSVHSPSPRSTFVVKTLLRPYYLVAPSVETMRMWVDVLITGAEGHLEYND